jgi:SAM-dependent methyltransferase
VLPTLGTKSLGNELIGRHAGVVESGFSGHAVLPRPAMTCQYRRDGSVAMGEVFLRHRAKAESTAAGRVLELGALHTSDLMRYRGVCFLALVQPSDSVRTQRAVLDIPAVQVTDTPPERLPFPAAAFDLVICSFSLCSADRPDHVLAEFGRVLRSSGQFIFLEHTRGPGAIGRTQDHIEAMLRGSGRCRPNLEVLATIRAAGFVLHDVALSWPAEQHSLHAPLIQGIAAHPDTRRERALRWLSGRGSESGAGTSGPAGNQPARRQRTPGKGGRMSRKVADCRKYRGEGGCTLTLIGEEEEVLRAATDHAVSAHGHVDGPELRAEIRGLLEDEDAVPDPRR